MGDLQGYTMPVELKKILMPMPEAMIRLITLKQLHVQAYWLRPVITGSKAKACPCCGGVHPLAAHGICGGCYEPAQKKGLSGPELLDHLAHRAKFGKKIRATGPKKTIQKSISPASESSSPAATPLAGAGQVECKDPSMQIHFIVQAIRMSLGLDDQAPLSAIPKHIDKLLTNLKHLKEQNDLADIQSALGLNPFDTVADIVEKITRIGQMRSDESAMAIQEINKNLELTSKNRELTEEIATLNRLLAKTPMDGSAEEEQGFSWSAATALMSICTALCLDQKTPLEEIVKHIGSLVEQRDMLEQERGAVAIALCAGEDDNLALIALRAMDEAQRAVCICAPAETEEAIVAKWSALPVPDGYDSLSDVMAEAINQAAYGKGFERHADHRPFHEQPIMRETEAVGLGHPAGQARKKILEAVRCCDDHPERAIADLLGAINYTAALVIAIRANRVEQAA